MSDLDELRRLAEAATRRRATRVLSMTGESLLEIGNPIERTAASDRSLQMATEDALFHTAASPSKVLALLDEIAALRRVAEAAKELTSYCEGLEDTREDWARYQDALHDTSAALAALDQGPKTS